MRSIFFILPSLETGGAELQTIDQINFLHSKGYKCSIIVLSNRTKNLHKLEMPKEQIHVFDFNSENTISKGYLLALSALTKSVLKVLPSSGTNIIAVLPAAHLVARLVKLFSRSKKIKIHSYYHALDYDESPLNSIGKKVFNLANSILARCTEESAIYISTAVKENIESNFFARNGEVIPNSVKFKEVTDTNGIELLQDLQWTSFFTVLIPGRLHRVKGHSIFLNALSRIEEYEVRALFAGDGPEKSRIESQIQALGLEKRVKMLGMIENDLLLSILKAVDLVVIPSLLEGFGNVAIEGLMAGATMLTSDAGGLCEIIDEGRNGYLFSSGDEKDLERKLRSLIERKLPVILGETLIREYNEKYRIQSQINRIIKHIGRSDY